MDANEHAERIKLVGLLAASFPAAQIGEQTIKAYVAMLEDVPVEILKIAVKQCANDTRFFPSLSEIRERVDAVSKVRVSNAAEAWEEVMIAMRRDGFYKRPQFKDSITQRAVNAMDWQALCSSENTVADRAHFMKIYDNLVEGQKHEARLLPSSKNLRAELAEHERKQLPAHETIRANSAS